MMHLQEVSGILKIEFEHRGLESMLATHDRISNRPSFAIVLASLVIGSNLIVLSEITVLVMMLPVVVAVRVAGLFSHGSTEKGNRGILFPYRQKTDRNPGLI